jgi:hypothetical protein
MELFNETETSPLQLLVPIIYIYYTFIMAYGVMAHGSSYDSVTEWLLNIFYHGHTQIMYCC